MKDRFVIVMGVSGSGKTRVGKSLAEHLGWDFFDADDLHPSENVTKMAQGLPLSDADRLPWLERLNALISESLKAGRSGGLSCSALKESYRRILLAGNSDVQIIYLKGSFELIRARMARRKGHFMKANMLRSQFNDLEEPAGVISVDVDRPVADIVSEILKNLV
jgi:gluconokinase